MKKVSTSPFINFLVYFSMADTPYCTHDTYTKQIITRDEGIDCLCLEGQEWELCLMFCVLAPPHLGLFGIGAGSSTKVVVSVELEEELVCTEGSSPQGSGQVWSLHSSGKNYLIFLNRWYCVGRENPEDERHPGRSLACGLHSSFKSFIKASGKSDLLKHGL